MTNQNFTSFPILTTERLTLRQLSIDDKQNIFALRSDKAVNKYLDREVSKTIEDAINFINRINENIEKNNSIYWVITLTTTRTFVGTICLFDLSNENSSCEIGYELMPKFQGQGIMKEAVEIVIDYAFQTLQFQKIVAITHNGNQNSTKLLMKFNFIKSVEPDKENPDFNIFTLTHYRNVCYASHDSKFSRLLVEEESKVIALKNAIENGIESGRAKNFNPDKHLEKLKAAKRQNG